MSLVRSIKPPCTRPFMQAIEPRITKAVFGVLAVDKSVTSRAVFGGTAPKNVRAQAKRWLKRLQKGA